MAPNITLDIETVPLPEAQIRAMLPPFTPDSVKVPANITKAETRDKYIAEAAATYGDDIIARAALSPRYGRLAIIGYQVDGDLSQIECDDERLALETAWGVWCDLMREHSARLIGYCIKPFDLQFMIRRSFALSVPVPSRIWRPARYGYGDAVVDLMEIWQSMTGQRDHTKLADVLAELGLPAKSGSGADFPALWAKDRKAALEYNAQDLRCEALLAERMGL